MSGPLKPPAAAPLIKQITLLMQGLDNIKSDTKDERYVQIVEWVKAFPVHARPPEVFDKIAKAFGTSPNVVRTLIEPEAVHASFENLVPTKGWLSDYVQYTRFTEPPTAFHFFVGATVLGATLRRNVHFVKGTGNLYPNLCVILVAPSGKCRKTTACDLGVKLFRDLGGNILADKITPEALVDAFAGQVSATGMIYAGELKQFLGSQKYMEGMIPLLTRLFDCPDLWVSRTIMRDEVTLTNVAISMLGASTMDWLRMLPSDTFGGGFMSRIILCVQEDTPRSFPFPPPLSQDIRKKLVGRMMQLSHLRGRFHMTHAAEDWYRSWYNNRDERGTEEKQFSGYFERKPDHLIRVAMILSISDDDSLVIEKRHMEHSLRILNWGESWLPNAFEQLSANLIGEDQMRMIKQLKTHNGAMKYSDWLRKNSSRMNATTFKGYLATLRESKLIDTDGAMYYLTPEGWKR